jgi:hypothetical protein
MVASTGKTHAKARRRKDGRVNYLRHGSDDLTADGRPQTATLEVDRRLRSNLRITPDLGKILRFIFTRLTPLAML